MKNMRFWRTALVATLVLTVMLSVTGGTIAWFTDSVTSASTIVQSGTLDVEMSWSDTQNGTYTDASKGAIFNHQLWEPGYTDVKYIKIENKGNLAFKYQIKVIPTVAKSGDEAYLGDVIDVYYKVVDDSFDEPKSAADVKAWNYVSNVTGTMNVAEDAVHGAMLDDQKELTVALALHMQESAGNEYQNKSVGDGFVVKLLATQYTHEEDSFNDQYDAGATYPSAAVIPGTEDFKDALAGAEENAPLVMTLTGDITYDTEGHHGENDITKASSITIDGQGKYKLIATGAGVTPIGDQTAPLTLKNLTVVDESVSYEEDSWEFGYLEMGGTELICENVIFTDPIMVKAEKATFINCSFVGYTDEGVDDNESYSMSMYGVWVINGNATFNGCTFAGTRGLKVCDMYSNEVGVVVVDGCTFDNLSEKPGVAIDDENTQDMNIIIKNSSFIDCQPGDQGMYIYETDNAMPTLENNSIVHATVVDTADGLKTALQAAGNAGAGNNIIKLEADVDLTNVTWTPIEVDGYHGADIVTIEGNGHTITNLSAPLFAGGFAGGSGIVIKDLTIADSTIVSTSPQGSGAFVECADSMDVITLTNCHLKNSTLKGSRTGGLIGWTAGYNNVNDGPVKLYVTVKDCSVVNCTLNATGSLGAIIGHSGGNAWTYITVENCTVKNCTLSSTDDGDWRVGVVVGTANVGEMTISNITESGNTLTQTGNTAPEGQSNLYDRFVPGETGKLTIN